MCTNKTLYKAGSPANITFAVRGKNDNLMDFRQVTFATDCLRMLANRRDMPIVELAEDMSEKGIFPKFYELLSAKPAYSKVQVVNRLQKLIMA